MKTNLHVLTRPDDDLARRVIEEQRRLGEAEVGVVDLTGERVDYEGLLEEVFAADTVTVW